MSTQNPRATFWREKFGDEAIKRFQDEQLRPYIPTPPPPAPGDSVPVDPAPLHSIPSPARVLGLGKHEKIRIGIIGAGVAGLFTAMVLDWVNKSIPGFAEYEIIEASHEAGGRVRTHHFHGSQDPKWDYFDVGAMRFPDIPIMQTLFYLFDKLNLRDDLVPYLLSDRGANQILHFNSVRVLQKEVDAAKTQDKKPDFWKDSTDSNGSVPPEFVDKGVDHWLEECFGPFKQQLKKNFEAGFETLMKYDHHSARSFMLSAFKDESIGLDKKAYPLSAVNWLERMSTGTGLFDMAFSEMVIDDLTFDYPCATGTKYGADAADSGYKWYCLKGGSEKLIQAMVNAIEKKPTYMKRVTAITPVDGGKSLEVSNIDYKTPHSRSSTPPQSLRFDYVISTIPLSSLRFVDLEQCNLTYKQKEGMRALRYDSSCKVGLKFKSRWWQTLGNGTGIIGGQTKTDRIVRTVVYPSYGVDDMAAAAVMIASYTWSQDALRVGGLIDGKHSADEEFLIKCVLDDLTVLHKLQPGVLDKELLDYFAYDWGADPFSLGAFALFGPGQFCSTYPAWDQPAAGGRLIFAGEALSAHHGWVEGALDSTWRAIEKVFCAENRREDEQKQLKDHWAAESGRTETEIEEITKLLQKQARLGAIFSAGIDDARVKECLNVGAGRY